MTHAGYYQSPTIHQNTIVFVCENDLWRVSTEGGMVYRLTANQGSVSSPALSPDGTLLAFTGEEEGPTEVYCMPAKGGTATRLTYLGGNTYVVGWTRDQQIIFASNTNQHFFRIYQLYTISPTGGEITPLPTGPARSISYGPEGGVVIGRNTTDLATWKRYQGGLTGDFWIDPTGEGNWHNLIELQGNIAMPLWVGERIYFVSDHGGIGNLYSCSPAGADLRQHTYHQDYYVRHPASDGQRIVYQAGADLYLHDPQEDKDKLVSVEFLSPRIQRQRKFVDAHTYLETTDLHPEGHSVLITARGKPFVMANWENAAIQLGQPNGVRYRLATWLCDGKHIVVLSDEDGEERLEVYDTTNYTCVDTLADLDIGRAISLFASPCKNQISITNHRHELIWIDLETQTRKILDRSPYARITDSSWSPDGCWLAYSCHQTAQTSVIKLVNIETEETWPVTKPVLRDIRPSFCPEGKYLYFFSYRDFSPVYDNLHFDLNFPWGVKPYLITLQADLPSPFEPVPRAPGEKISQVENNNNPNSSPNTNEADEGDSEDKETDNVVKTDDDEDDYSSDETTESEATTDVDKKEREEEEAGPTSMTPIKIDLANIQDRIIAFPIPEGRYGKIRGIKGKVFFSSYPLETARRKPRGSNAPPPAKGKIMVYDFEDQDYQTLIYSVTTFDISQNKKVLVYRSGNDVRVLKAGDKPPSGSSAGRKNGWLSLDRIKIWVEPEAEWYQMYREAWRLQRDFFWTEDMSKIDWQKIYKRYLPLVERVGSRAELSDLLWEMQGELGTSHAYEYGGDYRPEPNYRQGFLGADFNYDAETDSYQITRIIQGDVWDEHNRSPLAKPGFDINVGDYLTAINGRTLSKDVSPQQLLVNQARNQVLLTITSADRQSSQSLSVKALTYEFSIRYRAWVEEKRAAVHAASGGRIGYVHIPDMGAEGYAEFHRGYLAEVDRDGLIVDVRYNRGGHVSSLILEKLARRRLGYDVSRWGQPTPYPMESVIGPIVTICNELSASDGDMFSHAFKLMGLGPLIGTRTWGGVIGINPRNPLVDKGVTTQPEFSFWFNDIGWNLENYGTEPDIEVNISPQDYVVGRDTQLERAITEIITLLENNPPKLPDFGPKPSRQLPTLPQI